MKEQKQNIKYLTSQDDLVKVEIIAKSISNETKQVITTFVLEYPRIIHAELMTHRCLTGETELYFDLPAGNKNGRYRLYKMSIKEFYDKWEKGSTERISSQYIERDLSNINPSQFYTAKQLAELAGYCSASNIRAECRKGNIHVENPYKKRNEDFIILGQNFIQWNTSPTTYRQNVRSRLEKMKVRAFDISSGEVIHTNITDVWKVGDKPTFTLKAGGHTITGTDDHLILTKEGWKEMGTLTPDDFIVTISNRQNEKVDPNTYKKVDGLWRSSWQRKIATKLVHAQENCCKFCGKEAKLEIHHIIPVCEDISKCFEEDNVVAICNTCHKLEHETQGWQEGNMLNGYYQKVDSVTPTGKTETVYDLSVADHNHNFVANGIVVHNCFSRNSASSRAIPVKSVVDMVRNKPARPVRFGKNMAGMQDAGEWEAPVKLSGCDLPLDPIDAWEYAALLVADVAEAFDKAKYHKQVCNRLTEPFQFMKVIVTATSFDNWFWLRNHKDADPTIKVLAEKMLDAYTKTAPAVLETKDWHTPFYADGYWRENVGGLDKHGHSLQDALKISASCCAQVSYRKLDDSLEKANQVFERLILSNPVHASPVEHQATPISYDTTWAEGVTHLTRDGVWCSGNFSNWIQYRQLIPNHVCDDYDFGGSE